MKNSNESFLDLVEEAYYGKLQLPAFQRDYRWNSPDVMALYDSIRKTYPIGAMLLLSSDSQVDLQPFLFEGVNSSGKDNLKRLTLDGQQRITAGLDLFFGTAPAKYFIDLRQIKSLLEEKNIDFNDAEAISSFCYELDDTDGYIVKKRIVKFKNLKPTQKLITEDLLYIGNLKNTTTFNNITQSYENDDNRAFLRTVVMPNFVFSESLRVPITTLDEKEPITAITRIFAKLNTTGKKLTPVEIVTATLYAHDINLRTQVEEYHQISDYLEIIDSNGEALLQTIALLANQPPKKSLFPKTVTYDRFKNHYDDALSYLDIVGKLLTENLYVGLDITNSLLPYDSILSPMAGVLSKVKMNSKTKEKMIKWFIGSALDQRYQEGVHNKQENDVKEFVAWIKNDNIKYEPSWLKNTRISISIKTASPSGALGKLIKSLINSNEPIDALAKQNIGYYSKKGKTVEQPQEIYIFSKNFCEERIKDWLDTDKHNVIFNKLFVSLETKKKISNKGHNYIAEILNNNLEASEQQFLSKKCLKILSKDEITKKDFEQFIDERFNLLVKKLKDFGFSNIDEEDL
jgi:uncharacterized protein with ParB-like and HNH nuclease domain